MFIACAASQDLISPGASAPSFSLESDTGDTLSLEELHADGYLVIVFYPGNNTPVCTRQLCELRDSYEELLSHNAQVVGVNNDSREAHAEFRRENNYPFPLLRDTDNRVAHAYGTARRRGVRRSVVVIDGEGTVVYAWPGRPSVEEILGKITG
ncbi:peroxiredoxin [Chitinivibrio alkaliphilus]|uniref:peroxiredoxin n=1 Tax=Chitinivibrio alkaliphilus TaxID=1505232 RepID=UPI0004297F30|nr:peroxiredoxin [Chitinivibrio alkaliphilus]